MPRFAQASVVVLMLLVAATGNSLETPSINAQSHEPPAGIEDGALTRSARRQATGAWHGIAELHYANRPLTFINLGADKASAHDDMVQTILGDLWMMEMAASYGWKGWLFEAALPVAWVNRGGGPNLTQTQTPEMPAFGDMRLAARRHLWRHQSGSAGAFDVAGLVGWAPPTGTDGSWLGSGGSQIDAAALVSWRRGAWQADLEAGFRYRNRQALRAEWVDPVTGGPWLDEAGKPFTHEVLSVGSVAQVRVALGRRFLDDQVRARLEGQVRVPVIDAVTLSQQLVDWLIDVDWAPGRGVWRLFGGVGAAATTGYGAARARVLLGVRVTPGLMASDVDADGVDDRDDRCPTKAEDHDGFEDKDGCPDPDNDGDAVLDASDRCPLVAEDIDGFDDKDGCPEADNDGDGVLDAADRCPVVAEDRDGFDDHDGCPEPDNDGDGIPDVDDICPDKAENRNKHEDADGCPDVAPAPMVSRKGERLFLAGKIRFDVGTAALSGQGRRYLDAVILWLRSQPKVVALEVGAHTDTNGVHGALTELSQRRAEAVKSYLIRGSRLQEGQILAVGYGSDRALGPNHDVQGRSRNRRIEIKILAKMPPPAPPTKRRRRRRR